MTDEPGCRSLLVTILPRRHITKKGFVLLLLRRCSGTNIPLPAGSCWQGVMQLLRVEAIHLRRLAFTDKIRSLSYHDLIRDWMEAVVTTISCANRPLLYSGYMTSRFKVARWSQEQTNEDLKRTRRSGVSFHPTLPFEM